MSVRKELCASVCNIFDGFWRNYVHPKWFSTLQELGGLTLLLLRKPRISHSSGPSEFGSLSFPLGALEKAPPQCNPFVLLPNKDTKIWYLVSYRCWLVIATPPTWASWSSWSPILITSYCYWLWIPRLSLLLGLNGISLFWRLYICARGMYDEIDFHLMSTIYTNNANNGKEHLTTKFHSTKRRLR